MDQNHYCCEKKCIRSPRTVVDGKLRCGCYSWCRCACERFREERRTLLPTTVAFPEGPMQESMYRREVYSVRNDLLTKSNVPGTSSYSRERDEITTSSSQQLLRTYDDKPERYGVYRGIRCRCGEWLSGDMSIVFVSPCGHHFCSTCAVMFDRCFTCHVLITDRATALARFIF